MPGTSLLLPRTCAQMPRFPRWLETFRASFSADSFPSLLWQKRLLSGDTCTPEKVPPGRSCVLALHVSKGGNVSFPLTVTPTSHHTQTLV